MLASKQTTSPAHESDPSTPPEAAVEVEGLSYRYPNGHNALSEVSLHLDAGEKVALIGPNGAGKSTLLLHLNAIFKPQIGHVSVFGLDARSGDMRELRASVGFVFQDPDDQLFSPRVFEDVAYGPLYMGLPEDEVRRRVARALAAVGMEHLAERRPHELSLGERKRVALATVLSMDPKILVLDEPSAGLDPRARRGLMNLLDQVPLTMLVSTHDMHLVKDLFQRVVVMDGGQIVVDGPTQDILKDVDLLEAHGLEAV